MNIALITHCTIIIPWFHMATWNFLWSTVGTSSWNDRMIDGPSHVRTQGRHLRDFPAVFGIASGSFSNIGPYYFIFATGRSVDDIGLGTPILRYLLLTEMSWNICDDSADVIALQFSYSAPISALFLQVFMAEFRLALSLLRFKFQHCRFKRSSLKFITTW